jgi:uncharacterized membrane protein YhdT
MRKQHWYLRGWEYRETQADGGDLVYRGERYVFRRTEKELRSLKIRTSLCFSAVVAAYIPAALSEGFRDEPAWAGAPLILALIPLIYLGMAVVNLWFVGRSMTYRVYHASVKRLRASSGISCALFAATCAGQSVHAVQGRSWPSILPESAVCLVGVCALFYMHRRSNIDIEPPVEARA